MLTTFKKQILPLSLAISTAVLAGCGGGSDKDNAPLVTGATSPVVEENTTLVSTYNATDADGDAITLSLTGASSSLFTITQAGELSFISNPKYLSGIAECKAEALIVSPKMNGLCFRYQGKTEPKFLYSEVEISIFVV